MSELVVFIIGACIFAITVFGTVMAGGIALSKREIREDPEQRDLEDCELLEKTLPVRVKY